MLDYGFHKLKLDYSQAKNLPIGDVIYSQNFAGGYLWRIRCYPRGNNKDDRGDYLSMFLDLVTQSATNVTAVFDAFLLHGDGAASPVHQNRCVHAYPPEGFCACGGGATSRGGGTWSSSRRRRAPTAV
jgi:speckle-type POZ protein